MNINYKGDKIMNKNEIINYLKENCFAGSGMTEEEILTSIQQDYEDLLRLRNIAKASGDEDDYETDTCLYEEDSTTLDHCLDYMELFMTQLGIERMGVLKYDN
jgi:hypothetical protein